MQNLIDVVAAGFVFLLFASVYRKRSTAAVRFWMTGWLFVLLHFAVLLCCVGSRLGGTFRDLTALSTLIFCGLAFILSRQEVHRTAQRQLAVLGLLGLPWLGAVVSVALPHASFFAAALFGYLGAGSMLLVALRLFGNRSVQLSCILLLVMGCLGWLTVSLPAHDPGIAISVVLTECFGLNAVLLSFDRRRLSAGTATTSTGAVAWGAVWITANLVARFAPAANINPEIWNLPKYFVAAGMILTLFEEEIRSAELASEQYRLLFASNPHPMWMYDPETFGFLQVNEAAIAHYGFSAEEFGTLTLLDLVCEELGPALVERLRVEGPQQLSGPWHHRRKDGSRLQVDIASQPVLREGRRVAFALMQDVTERERLHAQLTRQAHHDVLTDLPNRALFEQRLQEALDRAEESDRKVALFCIDLDRFKQINDSLGHSAGDFCLTEVASRIARRLHGAGTAARSGGDEFMLLLSDLRSIDEAGRFAAALLQDLRASIRLPNGELEVSASIGLAVFPDDGHEREHLWRDADAAMYQAKRAGGAQWVRVSAEISSRAHEANEIELGLRRALKNGDLELHYQPQMTLDGGLHSLEALLRSKDRLLRKVPTDRMVSIAEESGLIVPLGNWVLEEACRQCRAWMDEGLAPTQIAVNVSPLQLTRFDFARQVTKMLERFRLSPGMLEFEVTESTVMPDRGGDAPHQIAALARMGIRFSVDDFGTGYSSLGRLHQLPVDSLKIDCTFTQRIADFNGTYPTVEAIIALAHTFGMKVVAEGVENEEQLRLLRVLRCDRVQGFLFSAPLSSRAATGFLRALEESAVDQVVA